MTDKPFVTADNQLDAVALCEAVATGDKAAERAIVGHYADDAAGPGLIAGLVAATLVMANVGVYQRAWPDAPAGLELARLGIMDTIAEGMHK
jgi:hypothetical protein